MKKLMARLKWLIIASLALVLVACGSGENNEPAASSSTSDNSDPIKIGILQAVDHVSLKDAEIGFIKALEDAGYVEGENVEYQILNAQGDNSNLQTMSQQLADNNDILLAVGTAAAQSLLNVEKEKPILFTAVTDPVEAGIVESEEAPGNNVTGASDGMPVAKQVELLVSVKPDAERVGVIYNSGEPNSTIQAREAIEAIEEMGLEAIETTVTSTNDVQQTLSSLMKDVDLLYIPTDNTMASTMATVGQLAKKYQVPVTAGAGGMVQEGGLLTYGLNYLDLGYQTGEMALKVIRGEAEPATMPVEKAKQLDLIINEDMADALGIDPATIEVPE